MTYHPLPTNPPQHDDYSAFVLGLVAGAAVGGGLALLFAPQEGAQTRHGLAAGAQQAGKRVTQAYGSLAGTARRSARTGIRSGTCNIAHCDPRVLVLVPSTRLDRPVCAARRL